MTSAESGHALKWARSVVSYSAKYRLYAWAVRVGLIAIVVEEYDLAIVLRRRSGFRMVEVDRRSGPLCELAIE